MRALTLLSTCVIAILFRECAFAAEHLYVFLPKGVESVHDEAKKERRELVSLPLFGARDKQIAYGNPTNDTRAFAGFTLTLVMQPIKPSNLKVVKSTTNFDGDVKPPQTQLLPLKPGMKPGLMTPTDTQTYWSVESREFNIPSVITSLSTHSTTYNTIMESIGASPLTYTLQRNSSKSPVLTMNTQINLYRAYKSSNNGSEAPEDVIRTALASHFAELNTLLEAEMLKTMLKKSWTAVEEKRVVGYATLSNRSGERIKGNVLFAAAQWSGTGSFEINANEEKTVRVVFPEDAALLRQFAKLKKGIAVSLQNGEFLE